MNFKTTSTKSGLFLASLEGAKQVFEHVDASEKQVILGPRLSDKWFQRWSKNDDDLKAIFKQFEEVKYEDRKGAASHIDRSTWIARIGTSRWTWRAKPLPELRRTASIARERKALERCVRIPSNTKMAIVRL